MLNIEPLLYWAKENSIPIRVRLHPAENLNYFWSSYVKAGLVTIEPKAEEFFGAIYRLKPRLFISWVSTTLTDIVHCGIMPITMSESTDLRAAELVYPVLERCLVIGNNFELLGRLLDDDLYYENIVKKLLLSRDPLSGCIE
jgi:hypothetical protein